MDQEPLQRLHREVRIAATKRAVAEQEVVIAKLTIIEVAKIGRLAQRQHGLVNPRWPLEPELRLADDQPHVEHLDGVAQSHHASCQFGAASVAQIAGLLRVDGDSSLAEQRPTQRDGGAGSFRRTGIELEQLAAPGLGLFEPRSCLLRIARLGAEFVVGLRQPQDSCRNMVARSALVDLAEERQRPFEIPAFDQQPTQIHTHAHCLVSDDRLVAQLVLKKRSVPIAGEPAQALATRLGRGFRFSRHMQRGTLAALGVARIKHHIGASSDGDQLTNHAWVLTLERQVDRAELQVALQRLAVDADVPAHCRRQLLQRLQAIDRAAVAGNGCRHAARGRARRDREHRLRRLWRHRGGEQQSKDRTHLPVPPAPSVGSAACLRRFARTCCSSFSRAFATSRSLASRARSLRRASASFS